MRLNHNTTPAGAMRVPLVGRLGRGRSILVDARDFERVSRHRWWLSSCRGKLTYARAEINGRAVAIHRWILGLEFGDPRLVDHVNLRRLDNRRSNLRICTAAENRRNSAAIYGRRTGLKGVTPEGDRFRAEIRVDGRYVWLGRHDTAEAAALAYDEACRELHGAFALTNADAGLLQVEVAR